MSCSPKHWRRNRGLFWPRLSAGIVQKLPQRIADAERAANERIQELNGFDDAEKVSVLNALTVLCDLRRIRYRSAAHGGLTTVEKPRLENLSSATAIKLRLVFSLRSAEERRRRKNSPTACPKTCTLKCVPGDRAHC